MNFPKEKGLAVGESSFFRCDDHYAIPPVDDSKTYRKEVRIFCQRAYSTTTGETVEYRLQNGVKIPECEYNGMTFVN